MKTEDEVRAKTKQVLWQGEKDLVKLTIVRKPDRTPLLILYKHENKKQQQLVQMQLKYFGDTDAEECKLTECLSCFIDFVLDLCLGVRWDLVCRGDQ